VSELKDMQPNRNKIIIDTNLWISYLITKNYKWLDNLIINQNYRLVFSQELIDEFLEVAKRQKFKKLFSAEDLEKLLWLFDHYGLYFKVSSNIELCRDSKDNFLLSLAKESKADFLITGDNDLLEIKKLGKTQIISASEFKTKKL
jgi:putative PIN family toxin of toxin-antitoxin system